ncbi:HlyD family secretion protein [Fusobacterium perfoetens]|uniref:HlyD family secretion protein n=1 Tax=Fusobacterium perfoetens TaxID=852 RepID=UPI001F42E9F6|nr:HlyD family secretion protein [Fusobacterium perfoetens]MCF2625740.1 HlyD family secretion protein [Fusobacterium perfoetens]
MDENKIDEKNIKKAENYIDEKDKKEQDNKQRKKALGKMSLFIFILILIGAGYGAYWVFYGKRYVKTENAYVNSSQNVVTAQTSGRIKIIAAENTQEVQKGQLIASIDDTDYKIALENAAADLGKSVRAYFNLTSNAGQIEDELISRESQLKKAETDFAMDRASYNAGLISKLQYETSKNNFRIAQAAVNQSRKALINAKTQAESSSIYNHPDVQRAIAAYKNAYVNLMRTKVYAPESGKIVKKSVFLGQQVNPSQELMTIINLKNIWVDVNLKETQMKNIKIGDRVRMKSDINGKIYSGYIQGISAGTGSALSLIPAQNATGNWIKIVQRVPVRVVFDEDSLKENGNIPVGSSMTVEINTDIINKNIVPYEREESNLYTVDETEMNKEIDKIIKNNIGKK